MRNYCNGQLYPEEAGTIAMGNSTLKMAGTNVCMCVGSFIVWALF